ncbi:MAG: hypothetical protein JSS79_14550 [Bacteroidetes bacterium]|nr:hypothetical protein [Bacteroidota bacterium]
MTLIKGADFEQTIKSNGSTDNYEIVEDSLVLHNVRTVRPIRNCKFKDLHLQSPFIDLELDNCEALNLTIVGTTGGGGLGKIRLTNCRIKFLQIQMVVNDLNYQHYTNLTIDGKESLIERILLNQGGYKSIQIENTVQIKEIEFYLINAEQIRVNSVSNSNLLFTGANVKKFIQLLSNTNTRSVFFDCDVGNISVATSKDIDIDFVSCVSKTITLYSGKYKSITLSGKGEFDLVFAAPSTVIAEAVVSSISFADFFLINKSRIKLRGARIEELLLSNFDNDGNFTLDNCTIRSVIRINSSNLGKTHFNNTTFSDSYISILDSNLSDCNFTNLKWRSDYKIHTNENITLLPAIRETYRQLKANYFKNGNKIEALEFQKHELETHYKLLAKQKFKRPLFRNLGNFLVVGTNKWSSDFGQNIWKPLVLLFAFHLLFFNLLLLSTPDLGITIGTSFDKELIEKGIRLYFQTLLPVHSSEIRFDAKTLVPIAGFWDFLIRISSGYFIYYFISASRKYHQ